jgi:hypothetical protein
MHQVRHECLEMIRQTIYRIDYDVCFPEEVAAARAVSRLGERGYSIYANNCEHFASWCKTGTDQSSQVRASYIYRRPRLTVYKFYEAVVTAEIKLPAQVFKSIKLRTL